MPVSLFSVLYFMLGEVQKFIFVILELHFLDFFLVNKMASSKSDRAKNNYLVTIISNESGIVVLF